MTLNATGAISLGGATAGQSVNLELGLSATAQISFNDAAVRSLTGTSSGATLVMPTGFYGKSSVLTKYVVLITSGTSYTLPSNWNPANNKIEAIGAGAAGSMAGGLKTNEAGAGGRGGSYARISNWPVAALTTLTIQVGSAGTDSWISNTGSYPTTTAQGVLAIGGLGAASVGTVTYLGGNGGTGESGFTYDAAGGGGGAAGPNGAGANGTNAASAIGGAGGRGDNVTGGIGGTTSSTGAPNPGGAGTEITNSIGSGGGGGGGGIYTNYTGAAGGSYGGGGGGGAWGGSGTGGAQGSGGAGGAGIIILTYYA
jgi:hypothetical protein